METLTKVQLKSWEWMSSEERKTQLKKERESKTDLWGLPSGRDRVGEEAGGQVEDGATAARRRGSTRAGPAEMQNEV